MYINSYFILRSVNAGNILCLLCSFIQKHGSRSRTYCADSRAEERQCQLCPGERGYGVCPGVRTGQVVFLMEMSCRLANSVRRVCIADLPTVGA